MKSKLGIVVLAASALALVACAPPPPEIDPEARRVAKQFWSPDPIVRDKAETRLKEMGARAAPALHKVAASPVGGGEEPSLAQMEAIRVLGEIAVTDVKARAPASEKLIELTFSRNPDIAAAAAARLTELGPTILPRLARFTLESDARRARAARSVMVIIDDIKTIDTFINMLDGLVVDPDGPEPEKRIITALREITHHDFEYDPKGDVTSRQTAMARWVAWWWETRRFYKNPPRVKEFLPKKGGDAAAAPAPAQKPAAKAPAAQTKGE